MSFLNSKPASFFPTVHSFISYIQFLGLNQLPSSFDFLNSFHTKNMIMATTTPVIPTVATVLEAEPNNNFQKVANNMAPMTRAAK